MTRALWGSCFTHRLRALGDGGIAQWHRALRDSGLAQWLICYGIVGSSVTQSLDCYGREK